MSHSTDQSFILKNGWLAAAHWRPSSNCSPRPDRQSITSIIVHNISLPPGEYGSDHILELFDNCLDPAVHPYFADIAHLKVSAHFLIRRCGELLQFVSTAEMAWHAGASQWGTLTAFNDFSVGVELEGSDFEPFTDSQYVTLDRLIGALRIAYPAIRSDLILGHSDIAPGRKTDPGPFFDWSRLQKSTRQN